MEEYGPRYVWNDRIARDVDLRCHLAVVRKKHGDESWEAFKTMVEVNRNREAMR